MKLLDAAAVEAVLQKREQFFEEKYQTSESVGTRMALILGQRLAEIDLAAIRALPDAREGKTCATCAEWASDPFYGDVCMLASHKAQDWRVMAVTKSLHERATLLTKPDHSCAAHREVPR